MKRLGIYFFYDKEGIVDDYIPFFLSQFKPFLSKLCIVVNGQLTEESKQKLLPYADNLLVRENVGFDAWAYKYALDFYGIEKLVDFDEVILTNFTFFGPFYPLDTLFDKMDQSPADLWGFFRWPNYDENRQCLLPHALSTTFISYRRSLLQSEAFKKYWEQLPAINSYNESVCLHEQRQTQYYERYNFRIATWIDYQSYQKYWPTHWPLFCAYDLIVKESFPFLKRRQFFVEEGHFTWGWKNLEIIDFLQKHHLYDVSLIYKNICRTQPIQTLPRHNCNWKGFCYFIKSYLHFNCLKRNKAKRYLMTQKDFHQAFYQKNHE
mgnify:CR=1 FL=1